MKTTKTSLLARMKAKKADPKKKPMTVEGSAARPRLDRPMRMKRAEGGLVVSEKNREDAKKLREDADSHAGAVMGVGLGTMAAHRGRFLPGRTKLLGQLAGAGLTGAGAAMAHDDANKRRQADRAERGLVDDDGKEDRRKRGGKVCK